MIKTIINYCSYLFLMFKSDHFVVINIVIILQMLWIELINKVNLCVVILILPMMLTHCFFFLSLQWLACHSDVFQHKCNLGYIHAHLYSALYRSYGSHGACPHQGIICTYTQPLTHHYLHS